MSVGSINLLLAGIFVNFEGSLNINQTDKFLINDFEYIKGVCRGESENPGHR
jgi:hypothetical protein